LISSVVVVFSVTARHTLVGLFGHVFASSSSIASVVNDAGERERAKRSWKRERTRWRRCKEKRRSACSARSASCIVKEDRPRATLTLSLSLCVLS
jgi:hypothetical protein